MQWKEAHFITFANYVNGSNAESSPALQQKHQGQNFQDWRLGTTPSLPEHQRSMSRQARPQLGRTLLRSPRSWVTEPTNSKPETDVTSTTAGTPPISSYITSKLYLLFYFRTLASEPFTYFANVIKCASFHRILRLFSDRYTLYHRILHRRPSSRLRPTSIRHALHYREFSHPTFSLL